MSTNTTSNQPLDIAIVGGGIAGLTLAIGLLRRNIPITVYESAHHFGEIGAGVFFQPNSVRAMDGLDPAIKEGFERVATHNQWESLKRLYFEYRFGEGERAGESILQLECPGPHAGVHRAKFLDEMIKLVPEGVAKFNKRVSKIEELQDGKLKLVFRDGSEAVHGCVIGCDGIHSEVRKFVLGPDHPAANAVFTGKYCHRGLVPMEKAVSILGEERAKNGQFYLGTHCHLLTFPIEHGQIFHAVAFASCETWDHDKWVVSGDVKDVQEDFKYFRGPQRAILAEMERSDIWAIFDSPAAPTFCKGNVVLIGDAAHATSPHHGSGAGFAIEDAYVLTCLMSKITSPEQLKTTFEAFNAVRHERGLQLVTSSRETGMMWDMELPEFADDVDKLRAKIDVHQDWIWDVDLEKEIEEGLRLARV